MKGATLKHFVESLRPVFDDGRYCACPAPNRQVLRPDHIGVPSTADSAAGKHSVTVEQSPDHNEWRSMA
jgi:hypothetical protein